MEQGEKKGGLYRAAVRWGLLLAGLVTATMRVPELRRYYVQWHTLAGSDPSAADAYRTFFQVELGITTFVLAMAAGLFYVLRPRRKKPA
jgi:hypothetical protein